MSVNRLLYTLAWLSMGLVLPAQVPVDVATVCNPCNLPYRFNLGESDTPGYREAADPSLIRFKDEYYLFASKCGTYFNSTDLVHWEPVKSNLETLKIGNDPVTEVYAPTVEVMNGRVYFTPSTATTHVYVTDDPKRGVWKRVDGAGTADNQNDPMMLFTQSRMYMYWGSSGSENDWLCGQEFDTKTMKPKGDIVPLKKCDKSTLGWEVPGDYNTSTAGSPWLEGVWVTEHNGRYYMQYAGPGTEYKSYCDAVYVSDSPLGPYTVQRSNPMCYRPEGFIAGAGHGSTFQDKYGNWWHITTGSISRRHMFERRLTLYPVFFDADGEMWAYTGFGDYPIVMPDRKIDSPDDLKTGWMLLSYGKTAKASSTAAGCSPADGVDEDIRTWWSAETGNEGEWYEVDLGSSCDIYAVQVNFADDSSMQHGRQSDVYRYIVEVSNDGDTWTTVSDKREAATDLPHDYIALTDVAKARYVRVYNVHTPSGRFSVSGLRVFGINPAEAKPAQTVLTAVERNTGDRRSVTLRWNAAEGATGYNIRYGISPDKLYLNYTLHGNRTSVTINSLNADEEYFYTVDTFNGRGVTEGAEPVCGVFSNPVIYADCPDPDVIRVGDAFYMVSTTMHYSPGCTIMKSHDLVNWKVIGYAHDYLEETDNFSLKNGRNDYANGSWAANLRYDKYENRFYLIVTCNTTQRSYIFTTGDIETGRWKRNIVEMCYDPGLLFEDTGTECRKWVVYPDADLGKYMGYKRELISNGDGTVVLGPKIQIIGHANLENPAQGLRAEGYHGYKIGDWYYIFMIQGVGAQRQEIVWRSRTMEPDSFEGRCVFAGNIVDENGKDYLPFTGVAQGGIVDTPDGRWYAMLFEDYGAVGRIPVLIPMTWDADGWPVIGNDGKSVNRINTMPLTGFAKEGITASDEFENGTYRYYPSEKYAELKGGEYGWNGSNLKIEWQWNHNPDNRYWSLTDRKGWLRLISGQMATTIRDARNTLTQRTTGPTCSASTLMDVTAMNDGDRAGLVSYQSQYGYVGVEQTAGKRMLVMRRATRPGDAEGMVVASIPLEQEQIYLRIEHDFTDKRDIASFFYSLDGNNWNRLGDELHMAFDWPDFVGQRVGLFYYSTKQLGGHVDFDYFRVNDAVSGNRY